MRGIPVREVVVLGAALAMLASPVPTLAQRTADVRLAGDADCTQFGYTGREREEAVVTARQQRSNQRQNSKVAAMPLPMAPPPPPPPPPGAPSPMIGGFVAPEQDRETYPGASANPIRQVADAPVSTFSIDVDTAAYSNVRRKLNIGYLPPQDSVRVEEMLNYFDYGYQRPATLSEPFAVSTTIVPSPWSNDRKLMHIGVQGYEIPTDRLPPLNLVLLIDTSGSMTSPDRLPMAKRAMDMLIEKMGSRDRIAIVAYAGSAGAVLKPVDGSQKLRIRCALDHLSAGGSTAGGEGLQLAYALARKNFDPKSVNRVVLLTDGDFNVGVSTPDRMRDLVSEQRKSGVYLSVYGFGQGNYRDDMMQSLAQNGNGTAAYVDTIDEARRLFLTDFAKGMFPIADDVKIQVEFNPATVREYRLIGYETRMLEREDFNNDRVDAGETGSGASVTALYEIALVGSAPSSDPLRYGTAPKVKAKGKGREIAFLKLRWKKPGQATSSLMERAIGQSDSVATLESANSDTRWAVAVAGFGETLRGSPQLKADFDLAAIGRLAKGAVGEDRFGQRAEFVGLVQKAEKIRKDEQKEGSPDRAD